MKLTIIIPARNEQDVIINTLDVIRKNVKTPHNILIIDDSTDNTAILVKKYIKHHQEIKLIRGNPKKKSFARALKIGFDKAKNGIAVVVMADMSDNPKTIDKMYKKINLGWDIVCGSRYIRGGRKVGGPPLQNILSFLVCKIVKIFVGIPTSDVSNAFKMYKLDVLKNVRINLNSGVEASMEIVLQSFFNNAKITEIPTTWTGRMSGESKFNIFHRAPRYIHIVSWSIQNSLRKFLGLDLNKY